MSHCLVDIHTANVVNNITIFPLHRVSAISAFCRLTTQTPSISNSLFVIVLTKPVIAILVPKLVAMGRNILTPRPRLSSSDMLTPKPTSKIKQRVALAVMQPKLYRFEGLPAPPHAQGNNRSLLWVVRPTPCFVWTL